MRVHIVTDARTLGYFRYCVQNHIKMAENPERLEFVAYCMDNSSFASLSNEKYQAIRTPDGSGSVAHALGIKSILQNISKDDLNVITDSDCVVLKKNWDMTIRNEIGSAGIIGTTFEDIGGFSSGDGLVQMYKKLPTLTWAAVDPKYDWNFDPTCRKGDHLPIDSQELSETFNLPIGFQLFRETYWQLPIHIRKNKIPFKCLKFVRPKSGDAKAVLSGEDYHTEFQLENGEPFVAHQRGSLSKAFRVHPLSTKFYDACERYINQEK